MLTVSKACEKSIAMRTVQWGGLFLFKTFMMWSMIEWSAVVVEC